MCWTLNFRNHTLGFGETYGDSPTVYALPGVADPRRFPKSGAASAGTRWIAGRDRMGGHRTGPRRTAGSGWDSESSNDVTSRRCLVDQHDVMNIRYSTMVFVRSQCEKIVEKNSFQQNSWSILMLPELSCSMSVATNRMIYHAVMFHVMNQNMITDTSSFLATSNFTHLDPSCYHSSFAWYLICFWNRWQIIAKM